jgi:hypothetical protein
VGTILVEKDGSSMNHSTSKLRSNHIESADAYVERKKNKAW